MSNIPSTFLAPGFTPNPMYNQVLGTYGESNYDLIQSVLSEADNLGFDMGMFGNDIPEELILMLLDKFDNELEGVIDDFISTPETPMEMPPPPHSSTLYGRICEDVKVVDIGSGNGRKAEKAPITDLTLTDKVLPGTTHNYSYKWKQLDAEDPDALEKALCSGKKVATSFMAMSQFDITHLSEYDGLHIVPDTDFLKAVGGQTLQDGVVLSRSRGHLFYDMQHDYGNGYEIQPGYLGVSTFKQQKNYIEFCGPVRLPKAPDVPVVISTRIDVDQHSTPKYDGIQLFYDVRKDGKGVVVNRKGIGRRIKHNFNEELQFVTEYMKGGVNVLIRIISYRKYVPWHSVSLLKYFCERKIIDICGEKLVAPGDSTLVKCPTDGIIMRRSEIDYRIKDTHTFDLDPKTWTKYAEYFIKNDLGYSISHLPEQDKILEYELTVVEGEFSFVKIKERNDKNNTTDVSTLEFILKYVM